VNRRVRAALLSVGAGLAVGAVIGLTVGFGGPAFIAAIVTVVAAAASLDRNALS